MAKSVKNVFFKWNTAAPPVILPKALKPSFQKTAAGAIVLQAVISGVIKKQWKAT